MKLFFFIPLLFFTQAFAEESAWSFRGNVRTVESLDTQHEDSVEHYYDHNIHVFAETKYSKDSWSGVVSLLARQGVATPNDTKLTFEADLYEAYIRYVHDIFSFEAGERIVRWGVMEYVSPTDKLNPRDIRQYISPEVEDTYIPVPMIRTIFDLKPWSLDLIYQPFFRRSRFDVIGTDVSFFQPSVASVLSLPFQNIGSQLDDDVESNFPNTIANEPSKNPLEGEGGGKLGFSFGQTDLSILYLNKRDTFPTVDLPQGKDSLVGGITSTTTPGTYPRSHLTGGTFRSVFDNGLSLKGEVLYQSRASLYNPDLFLKREALLKWGAGLEYDWDLKYLFLVEYAQDRVLTGSISKYFLQDSVQHYITPAAIFNFRDRTWTLEFKGTFIPNQDAYFLNPEFFYRPAPPWEFSVGTQVYGGDSNSIFGLIAHNDLVFVTGKYLF